MTKDLEKKYQNLNKKRRYELLNYDKKRHLELLNQQGDDIISILDEIATKKAEIVDKTPFDLLGDI